MAVHDEFPDVLFNIEAVIMHVFRRRRDLIDFDVEEAIDALIRDYKALEQKFPLKPHRLYEKPEMVYSAVKEVCDWMLGIGTMSDFEPLEEPHTPADIITCLKRIKKSIKLWNKERGRQGYLLYVQEFIA